MATKFSAWTASLKAARSHHARAAKSYQALTAEGSGPLVLLASTELDLAHSRVLEALEGFEACLRAEVLGELDRGRRLAEDSKATARAEAEAAGWIRGM